MEQYKLTPYTKYKVYIGSRCRLSKENYFKLKYLKEN